MDYAMRLDKSTWRFCVTPAMLHALGDPDYVQIAVMTGAIAIKRSDYGLRVNPTASGVFYITSKGFFEELQKVYPMLGDGRSFRFHGELVDGSIRFPLDQVERISQ